MDTVNPLIWKIIFYTALAALVIVLFLKKRKQTKDSIGIDYKNQKTDTHDN